MSGQTEKKKEKDGEESLPFAFAVCCFILVKCNQINWDPFTLSIIAALR